MPACAAPPAFAGYSAPDRLRRVFDHGEPVCCGELVDRIHLAAQTKKMHRDDRPDDSSGGIDELARRVFRRQLSRKRATAVGERLKVAGSMSTKIGVAPTRAMQPAVAKKV